ncbi:hypothetical protein CC1G_07043 [Coprinopsis cinerea okayama7|uniref:Uncharacterized protein n=1 Tax=Coprinopsis cinerea (strain Okayama-7 / 130 / ATCC MYA-4618 / FGSC 9003) TaxID=240176 RepID=A8NU83_COPC7|nr:hypothetical protein CC1G_07043 [Coprinopsis cinerea okayama7\|eukprot:XP_001836396.2 hypothetical protein CC1G_07043 [Coprinopsis cinerea okayama7\
MSYNPYLPSATGIPTLHSNVYAGYEQLPYPVPAPINTSGHPLPQGQAQRGAVRPQASLKQRRLSQSGRPYDAAQSPTRTRFQDINASYGSGPTVVPAHTVTSEPNRRSRTSVDAMYHKDHLPAGSRVSDRQPISPTAKATRSYDENTIPKHLVVRAEPGFHGPMNHMRVPQRPHDAGPALHPSIHFRVRGFPEPGVKVSQVLALYNPVIVGQSDKPLKDAYEKSIHLVISWPGYPSAVKRVSTLGGEIKKTDLFTALAKSVMAWSTDLQKQGIRPERGYEAWAIGKFINPNDLFITELVHRGMSFWQMELWAPVEMI